MAHLDGDNKIVAQAQAFADEVWEDVVRDIDRLLSIESVEDKSHADSGQPFGPNVREALDCALGIARRLGLNCSDCEGYIGYAELPGKSSKYLATIAHADIVPLGTGWTVDPLRVTRREGYLLGRGVLDDKGPLVLSLYAAHFFARRVSASGKLLPYSLRCLVGANEETGMEDVEYYLRHFEEPVFCFTPDAEFPLICGEKGRFFAEFTSRRMQGENARIVLLAGGVAPNAIPGRAEAVVRASKVDLPLSDGITIEDDGVDDFGNELVRLVAEGKGGHASLPEGTKNAIGVLVEYLLENGLCNDGEREFLEFEHVIMSDTSGEALGIAATDDLFEPLTCVGGTVCTRQEDSHLVFAQTIDVRYPKSTTGEAIRSRVAEVAARYGCCVSEFDDMVPFYMAPESKEVEVLVQTYNELTGRDGNPFTIGGGTYARHFSRAVAFGPNCADEPKPSWVGSEHGADEGVLEDALKRALVIYIVAISRLMDLSF